MRQNPHVRICGGPGSATTLVYPTSEYCRCPPRLPTPTASQAAIASGANHTVISPRWTSAR